MPYLRYIPLLAVTIAVGGATIWAAPAPQGQTQGTRQEKPSPDRKKSSRGGSLTGCVDQQEGHYVLLEDRNLTRIAMLEPVGFPNQGFAKYLGHKVTVRGTRIADSNPTRFQVRAIENVSDRCTPQDSQQTKQ